MATIQFYINKKDPNREYTINVFLQNGRQGKFKKSTGLKIIGKHWDQVKQSPLPESKTGDKSYYVLKRQLKGLRAKLESEIVEANHKNVTVNSEWLGVEIDTFLDKLAPEHNFEYVSDYAEYFIECMPYKIQKNGATGVKEVTIKQYRTALNKVLDYEKKKGKRFKINEVNLKFHADFIQFLSKEQRLNLNTIGKYIKCLKSILKGAKRYGIEINKEAESDGFRSTNEKVHFVTLDEEEIDKIFNLDLSNTPYLDNTRNWLIIGVWTGARVSDLLNFTLENINKDGFLEYTAKKTKQKIEIPLHWQIQSIIAKNDWRLPHKISPQKYNDWIKNVCEMAGINKMCKGSIFITDKKRKKKEKTPQRKKIGTYPKWMLVSTHTARRSFATNHYGKLSTPVIMSATGHTTEKQLLEYIGKTPKDNALVLQEFWQKEYMKQSRKPNLEVVKEAN
ncbi:tyrosine-type recombinase/integrase [Tamlana flava]|uniref:tyrosine-type recombinase/integrase n=1 Tax=Tamlana flava TaxID=3158572 RepID=UPI00351BB4F6